MNTIINVICISPLLLSSSSSTSIAHDLPKNLPASILGAMAYDKRKRTY